MMAMLAWMTDPQAWVALATLTALEIVLGIDNIIFISILVDRLPPAQRQRAWRFGLGLAMLTRILLLLSLVWMAHFTTPLLTLFGVEVTGRSLVLVAGGLFLLAKSTLEIHATLEPPAQDAVDAASRRAVPGLALLLVQIALLDIVFSLDSVITAVGMAQHVPVMVLAIVIAVGVMLLAARPIGDFVAAHPTIRMLALSFLMLIGVVLMAEGFMLEIPKGYLYFAMAFSVTVEMLNLRVRRMHGH